MGKDGEIKLSSELSSGFEVLRDTGIKVDGNNPESQEITALINRNESGMIPFSAFMEKSLYGRFGYYSAGKVEIGSKDQDFNTASESSMFFGTTIGDEILRVWHALGSPEDFSVIEMGAGEGGLAESVLEYIKIKSPELFEKLNYNILDLGRGLIDRQRERLSKTGKQVNWVYGSATELPFANVNGVFLSNELPDAFPVEQVVRNQKGELGQVYVGVNEKGNWTEYWGQLSPEVKKYIEDHKIEVGHNDYVAINLLAAKFQENISQALDMGAVITFDYGGMGQSEKNQDVRSYAKKRIMKEEAIKENWKYRYVGDVDITADVNFKVLEEVAIAHGLTVAFSGKQGELLQKMGMDDAVRWLTSHYKELSWGQIEKLSRSMYHFGLFHLGFFDFYGHMLLRGITREAVLPKLSGDDRALEFKIRFPVKGAKPGNRIMITKEREGDEPPDVELGVVEEDGTIEVHPHFLRGTKFIKDKDMSGEPTTIFYDFTNQENFYSVLKEFGYKVD